ncbi:hypothetical protein BJV78DRAFT_323565 [Lactifluus subvellereus]|nr:hypothetical protein BJV78DRAFT_323565 [Lactifluus subvellereus]
MRFSTFTLLISAATAVNAHFQLAFPPPRGVFDDANEVKFCDNYVNAVNNRSEFPLSGGFVTLNSEHSSWSLSVLISTVQDPTSFNNFTSASGQQQLARNFASASGEGGFCIPLDLNNTGISGVQNGANVTIQLVFNGGDGSLYQCADLTLSNSFTIPSSVSCSNATSSKSKSNGDRASEVATTGFTAALGFIVALITNL